MDIISDIIGLLLRCRVEPTEAIHKEGRYDGGEDTGL